MYDSSGTLIDWYKATEERRKKGLEWVPSKSLGTSFQEGCYSLRYVHREERSNEENATTTDETLPTNSGGKSMFIFLIMSFFIFIFLTNIFLVYSFSFQNFNI